MKKRHTWFCLTNPDRPNSAVMLKDESVVMYRDPAWDVNDYLIGLRSQGQTWRQIYWRFSRWNYQAPLVVHVHFKSLDTGFGP